MHATVGPAVRLIGLIIFILRNTTSKKGSEHTGRSGFHSMDPGKDLALKLRERRQLGSEQKEDVRKKV